MLLLLIALIIVVGEIVAAKKNRFIKENGNASTSWLKVYRWRWVVGLLFVIASVFVYYPMLGETESYRVMGFPLMAAVFDEAGRDYVGPFTVPFLLGNAIIWYFIPHFILIALNYIDMKVRKNA